MTWQLFDVLKAAPIARNGYHQYTHITQVWDMYMPFMPDDAASEGVLGGSVAYDSPDDEDKDKEGSVDKSSALIPSAQQGKVAESCVEAFICFLTVADIIEIHCRPYCTFCTFGSVDHFANRV